MLINSDLTKLSTQEVVDLLEESGYNESSSDIVEAKFIKVLDNRQLQYMIEYYDIDDNLCSDYVFVFINADGKLVADY